MLYDSYQCVDYMACNCCLCILEMPGKLASSDARANDLVAEVIQLKSQLAGNDVTRLHPVNTLDGSGQGRH